MNTESPLGAAAAREEHQNHITDGEVNRRLIQPLSIATPIVTPRSTPPPAESPHTTKAIGETNNTPLSIKNLLIPVAGVASGDLRDSFYDSRSEGRTHNALDIMAARDTPVLATDDGRVLKLHSSVRGGVSLYQSDNSGSYVYFYGHLTRYADGITEGKPVRRGEVIAFVGDSGNAGAGNCHLHFGISRVTEAGRWSGGEPINPYPLLSGKPGTSSIESGK
ncbi:MAG TPA: M23 family metallopeptidase [Blastocatellia bacterium]|nr:M23 family metallopeptidase [Blastocatellia bacterium]